MHALLRSLLLTWFAGQRAWLTVSETAHLLGITEQDVYAIVEAGRLRLDGTEIPREQVRGLLRLLWSYRHGEAVCGLVVALGGGLWSAVEWGGLGAPHELLAVFLALSLGWYLLFGAHLIGRVRQSAGRFAERCWADNAYARRPRRRPTTSRCPECGRTARGSRRA